MTRQTCAVALLSALVACADHSVSSASSMAGEHPHDEDVPPEVLLRHNSSWTGLSYCAIEPSGRVTVTSVSRFGYPAEPSFAATDPSRVRTIWNAILDLGYKKNGGVFHGRSFPFSERDSVELSWTRGGIDTEIIEDCGYGSAEIVALTADICFEAKMRAVPAEHWSEDPPN